MLAKKFRLPLYHDSEFTGKKFRLGSLLIINRANELDHRRVAFIVGRKVAKKAVDRNRIKRQLRHAAQDWVSQGAGDYLIIALPEIVELEFDQIRDLIKQIK